MSKQRHHSFGIYLIGKRNQVRGAQMHIPALPEDVASGQLGAARRRQVTGVQQVKTWPHGRRIIAGH